MVDQLFRNALTDLAARVKGSPIAQQFQRVTGVITSFGRSNPLIVTSIAGLTSAGIVAVARIRKKKNAKKRKKKISRKAQRKKDRRRRSRKVTHRRPRHRGHKTVTFKTKGGKKVRFLVRGQKRSPKHGKKKARRFIKGSPEAKRFMAKLRRMKK